MTIAAFLQPGSPGVPFPLPAVAEGLVQVAEDCCAIAADTPPNQALLGPGLRLCDTGLLQCAPAWVLLPFEYQQRMALRRGCTGRYPPSALKHGAPRAILVGNARQTPAIS
ncbi:MAG: hypothetical protein TE42_07935 [Candidatus Synechococcus spongiarum SP3]|uniref:Uncharacterized protein n=1 Tax=Candidatus Synechococcus spongiarum SP3 TaxID=1604020 RepID=A0A0G2HKV9_9SYNE|nr:MAG: hypothetical protein TE42_07935 [Candidatus Synechococcus spongiarum SP3]